MKTLRFLSLGCLVAVSALALNAQATANSAAEIKRITDRYALTRARISALLDLRLAPVALPANPPNPFYQPPTEVLNDQIATINQDPAEGVPDTSDLSDSDTLRKYAGTLKIGGTITLNGVLHLTVNNTTCKVGDIITVGNKDHPIYLKMTGLTPNEFTLSLNEASLSVPLRKP